MYSYCNMTNDINLTNKKHSNKISFLEEDLIILDKLNRYMLHNEFVIKNINNTENIDKYNKTEKKVLSNVNVIKHDKKEENYYKKSLSIEPQGYVPAPHMKAFSLSSSL